MASKKIIVIDTLATLALFLVIGEISFRLPGAAQAMRYAYDDELGSTYMPDQVAVAFQGNYSVQSPPITINDRGFRGVSWDSDRASILV